MIRMLRSLLHRFLSACPACGRQFTYKRQPCACQHMGGHTTTSDPEDVW